MAKVVAKIYGDALFDLSIEKKQLDQIVEEIEATSATLSQNSELLNFLNHPKISNDEKIATIENIFKKRFSDITVGFLVTIVEKGRYNEMQSIFQYFLDKVREYRLIGKAKVISAFPLDEKQKNEIEASLLRMTKYKEFQMDYDVDSSIIGGLIIRIGDRVVDSSIKSKLERMKKELMKIQLMN